MKQNESDNSEEEGFFKPIIKVQDPNDNLTPDIQKEQKFSFANDIRNHQRPHDFLPRVLTHTIPYQGNHEFLNSDVAITQREEILRLTQKQKMRKCKYLSLKEKYFNNALYELVYSKTSNNSEYNSYIFCLERTTDYNPNDYKQAQQTQTSNKLFNSCFESGNLLYAYRVVESKMEEYDLIMQNDTNTNGFNQWFYFSFNNRTSKIVKFNIVNFIKKHLMFQEGVRPVGFSTKQYKQSKASWHFVGQNIEYQKSYVNREIYNTNIIQMNYYTLSFVINFEHENDLFYLALNYPYTYTRLINFVDNLIQSKLDEILIQKSIVCYSISNNPILSLKIKHINNKNKHKILLLARQHSGETVGSFVLEGFLKEVVSHIDLLSRFQVIVIPMLNPDGVIYGNFRTNLAGFDLNRQWKNPDKYLHTEIYEILKFIRSLQNLIFVLDFHGHSKKLNSFIYSCFGNNNNQFRLYPYIFSKQCPYFSLKDCTFNITQDKIKTARVTIFNLINIPQVYTLQTSFYGYISQNGQKLRFKICDILDIGKHALKSMSILLLKKQIISKYEKQIVDNKYLFDQWLSQNRQDIGSQSNPSEDQLPSSIRIQKVMPNKKKKELLKKQKIKQRLVSKQSSKMKHFNELLKNRKYKQQSQSSISKIKPTSLTKKKQEKRKIMIQQKEMDAKQIKVWNQASVATKNSLSNEKQIKKIYFHSVSERKVEPVAEKSITSNLFSNANFYTKIKQKFIQNTKKISDIHKIQSLQFGKLNKQTIPNFTQKNNQAKDKVTEKQASKSTNEFFDSSYPSKKHSEKIYIIRQNKIINSITKLQKQDDYNRVLEQQINQRTTALKNCQKKMRGMSLDISNSLVKQKLQFISQKQAENITFAQSYKFPTLSIEKRNQKFLTELRSIINK